MNVTRVTLALLYISSYTAAASLPPRSKLLITHS